MNFFDNKLLICAVASVVAHVAIAQALELLPKEPDPKPKPHKIEIRVVPAPELPPPPEPPKPPEPVPPPPKPEVSEPPPPRPVHAPTIAPVAHDVPPPDHTPVTTDTTDTPVFGVTMESTSAVGTGPAVPVGNTTKAPPGPGAAVPTAQKPLAAPVAAFEATKMPLPQGRCFGKYTDEAKAAGIEGTVILDLIVGEDGHTREIKVVSGLANGLTEAAITALKDCQFSPGEKDGKPVAVRVRGFKIRFVLEDAN